MQKAIQLFFKILIIGIVISAVISGWAWGVETLRNTDFAINTPLVKDFSVFIFVYGVLLTIINILFFNYFEKEIDWKKNKKYDKYRFLLGLAAGFVLNFIGVFLILFVVVVGFQQQSFEYFISDKNYADYQVSSFIALIILIVVRSVYFYKSVQENKIKEQKIIANTASAQFESLKNQIDPHFLFNSLNVLSSLIEENPDTAQDFTTSLSKIYRYVLEQKDKELVPIEEEISFAKTYMELLNIRFENSITFSLPDISGQNEGKVVPLSLQLLLENCIKHNVVSEQKPLHIKIYIENGYLVVENNFQKKETLNQERKGVGLQNIVSRYAILTKRNVLVEETEQHFKVKIPILTKQLDIMDTTETNQNTSYLKAQKRVKDIKEFYSHLTTYCLIIPLLIFINLYTYSDFLWFFFPMFGWGIGLAIHAFTTFGYGKDWEEKKIRELMEKDKQNNWE